eukprot:8923535-Alexandrium_andersonii.AAC.1
MATLKRVQHRHSDSFIHVRLASLLSAMHRSALQYIYISLCAFNLQACSVHRRLADCNCSCWQIHKHD